MKIDYGTLRKINCIEYEKNNHSILKYGKYFDADFTLSIPLYGFAPYLEETFISIKNALINNLRVQIIVSDTKIDDEDDYKIINLLNTYLPNLYAFFKTEKRMSQYDNFNRCIVLSQTVYVGMIHNDDILNIDYFDFVKKFLSTNHDNVALVCGKIVNFFNTYKTIKNKKYEVYSINKFNITINGFTGTGIPSCGMIFNRNIFVKIGGFDRNFNSSGDAFYGGKLILNKYKILFTYNITGFYRIANNSSLKLDTCQGFISQDEMFRNDWRNNINILYRIISLLLDRYVYSRSIDYNVRTFGKINPKITKDNLDYKKKYKKYMKFGFHRILISILYCISKFHNLLFSKQIH